MRVLVLSSLSSDSGCFLRAQYLAHSLRRAGATVIFPMPPHSLPFMFDFIVSFIQNVMICFTTSYDIGIAIKPYPNTLIPLLLKRIISKSKVITDIDDIDFGYRTGLLATILKIMQKPLPKKCDSITYHNDALKKFIHTTFHVPADKLYKLEQGVDTTLFKPLHGRRWEKRKKTLINKYCLNGKKIIVYAGHLNIASDLDAILKAVHMAYQKDPQIHLLIAGGGPMYHDFIALTKKLQLSDIVSFTGYLSPALINECINCADIAVAYYKSIHVNRYRVSMKVREYMGAGAVVVCNSFGDLKRFKKYAVQSKNSIHDFSKSIIRALRNRIKLKKTAEKAYHFITAHYDWNVIGRNFYQQIKKI